jgi:hypothetical protein
MASTYRAYIDDGDFRKRDFAHMRWACQVSRASKATDRSAVERFVVCLSGTLPVSDRASAYLERSDRNGTRTILRASGRVTGTMIGRDGFSRIASAGEWVTELGEVLATAGR